MRRYKKSKHQETGRSESEDHWKKNIYVIDKVLILELHISALVNKGDHSNMICDITLHTHWKKYNVFHQLELELCRTLLMHFRKESNFAEGFCYKINKNGYAEAETKMITWLPTNKSNRNTTQLQRARLLVNDYDPSNDTNYNDGR